MASTTGRALRKTLGLDTLCSQPRVAAAARPLECCARDPMACGTRRNGISTSVGMRCLGVRTTIPGLTTPLDTWKRAYCAAGGHDFGVGVESPKPWAELNGRQRKVVMALGWNADSWDANAEHPKWYREMTGAERRSAASIGLDQIVRRWCLLYPCYCWPRCPRYPLCVVRGGAQGWDSKKYLAHEAGAGRRHSRWGGAGPVLLALVGISCALGAAALTALRRRAAASARSRPPPWWLEWHELCVCSARCARVARACVCCCTRPATHADRGRAAALTPNERRRQRWGWALARRRAGANAPSAWPTAGERPAVHA